MQRAVNPQTGEVIFLVDNQWVPPAKTATNADGVKAFLVNNEWVIDKPKQTTPQELPEEQSMFRQVADVPVNLARGAVSGVRMIADAFGADNPLSQTLRGGEEYLGGLLSAQAQNNQQEISRIMEEAEGKGAKEEVIAAFNAFLTAPLDLISNALGTAGPNLVGGLAANLLKLGVKGVGAVVGGTGAAMGAGVTKGGIYSAVKEELENSGIPPEQAEIAAQEAQSYGGENLDQIALSTIIGAVASRTGIEPRLVQNLTGKVSQGLAKRGVGKFTQTVVGEAGTEGLQAGQEQVAQNIALQRQGFDVPTFRGAAGQATLDAITGGGLGAGVSMVAGKERDASAPAPAVTPTRTEAELQAMREEQQTADAMRKQDEAQALVTGQAMDRAGQYKLNLPRAQGVVPPLTSVQGTPLPAQQRGFDQFGRPLAPEVEGDATPVSDTAPTPMTQMFDESLALSDIKAERERLESQIKDIDDTDLRKQARARVKELKGIESERVGVIRERETRAKRLRLDESGQALLDFATPRAPAAPPSQVAVDAPTSVTPATFDQLGIGKNAVIRKNQDLINADLTDPDQVAFVRTALEAYRDAPNRAPDIQEKITTFLSQLPETRPVINAQALDTLKLPKQSALRKQLLGKDMSDPEQNQAANKILRSALQNPKMPADTKQAIRDVIEQSEFTRQGELFGPLGGVLQPVTPRAGATDATPEPTPAPSVEPTTERPASEPSVGVASMGDGPAPSPEGAPRAVSEPEVGGLAGTDVGTRPDVERREPVSPTVTETSTGMSPADAFDLMGGRSDIDSEVPADPGLSIPIKERTQFGRGLGSSGLGTYKLRGRSVPAMSQAIAQGNAQKVLDMLSKSKNKIFARVGELGKKIKGLQIVSDPDAGETQANRNRFNRDVVSAKINLALLDMARQAKGAVDAFSGDGLPDLFDFRTQVDVYNAFLDAVQPVTVALDTYAGETKDSFNQLINSLESGVGQQEDLARAYVRISETRTAIPAAYDKDANTIRVSLLEDFYGKLLGVNEATVAHEVAHAVTIDALLNPTVSQRPVIKRLQDLFDAVRNDPLLTDTYGVTAIEEFVAEGFSNPEFQLRLSRIPYKNTSALGKFAEYVANLLGLKADNAFTEFLTLVDGIDSTPAAPKTSKKTPKTLKDVKPPTVVDTAPATTPAAPPAPAPAQPAQDIEYTIDTAVDAANELAAQDTPDFRAVARLARNAFNSGLLPEAQYRAITQSVANREESVAVDLQDSLISEQSGNNIANAVQALRAAGDSAGATTPTLDSAINSLNPTAALEAIVNDDSGTFNAVEKLVAKNVLLRQAAMPTMRMVDSLGTDANGSPILGQYNSITDEISLVRGTADSHTFMHEMIHAFVHRTIIVQEREGARRMEFRELQDVYNYVKANRPDLSTKYGMSSLTEFASEAMSNRDFQMQLMGIPYQKQSAFSRFARALRDLLGLGEAGVDGNTLFTAMVAVDGLMRDGRDLQITTTGYRMGQITYGADTDNVPNAIQSVQNITTPIGKPTPRTLAEVNAAPDPAYRSAWRKFINTVTNSEIPLLDIIRQQLADEAAPLAKKLSAAFSQGVRSAFGDINPMVWLRQAYDHDRVALQVFRVGGLRMNLDGLWEAFQLKDADGNNVSPGEVINKIKALADKEGLSYAGAKARIGTVLEGMRLKDLREHNSRIEALAQALARSGDVQGAFEKRQEKFALHKTFAEIDADVAVFENSPEIQEIQKMMNLVREGMIDAMVKGGRLSAEKAQGWKAAANYVPFDRLQNIMENPEIVFAQGRRGIAAIAKLPELVGSFDRPVVNTIDNYMKKIAWMTEQTMRTSAITRTLDFMVEAGMARQIRSAADANENHLVLPPQYKDGKVVLYEVQNQYDLAAFLQTPEVKSGVLTALGGASRLLRATITATPMFSIKQVIDDSQRVMFNSGLERPLAGLGRTLYYFPRVWWSQAFGKDFRYMRELERLGIAGEFDYNPINPLSTLELDAGAVQRSPVRALLHRMEQIAKASDMAARLAVYEQTMQETNNTLLAQTRARELINFNRRGASKTMRAITNIVPFFNSYVQGNDLLYRGFTGVDAPSGTGARAARKMFISRVATMAALSTIYAMAMSEDDYYKGLDDPVRDRNWILPKSLSDGLGLKQPIKITVPNEFGFLFKSIPERVVQYMKDDARGEAKEVGRIFRETIADIAGEYGMMPIPAAIKPILENITNFSSFTRRELVSPSMQARPAALQYTSSTSELGKAFGKEFNISPIVVDNYIRGYFGMAGGAVSVVADALMNPNRPDRGMEQIPFLSIGLVAPVGTRSKNEFYEFRDDVAKAVSGANLLKDDPVAFEAFYKKYGHLVKAAPFMNQKLRALKTLRAYRKDYETDPVMSGEQKREAILELQRRENEITADVKRFESQVRRNK